MSFPVNTSPKTVDCSVCLDSLPSEAAHKTSCSHYFHKECAVKAFNASIIATDKASCPLCRKDQQLGKTQEAVHELILWMHHDDNKGNSIGFAHQLSQARLGEYVNLLAPNRWSLLARAVEDGSVGFIHQLVDAGADASIRIPTRDDQILSPLMSSFFNENPEVFQATVNGFHPSNIDESPEGSFKVFDFFIMKLKSIKIDRIMIAEELIAMGANVNSRRLVKGLYPLHLAAQSPYNNVLQLLLKHGAEVDVPSDSGLTPLALALSANQVHNVWTLLDHKASTVSPRTSTLKQIATAKGFDQVARALPNDYTYLATDEKAQELINNPQKLRAVDDVIDMLNVRYQDPEAETIDISQNVVEGVDPKCPVLFVAIMANKVDRVWSLLTNFGAQADMPFVFEQDDLKMVLTPLELAKILGREDLLKSAYYAESVREYEDHYKAPAKPFFHAEAPAEIPQGILLTPDESTQSIDSYSQENEGYTQPNRNARYAEAPF